MFCTSGGKDSLKNYAYGGGRRRGETSVLVYSFMFLLAFIIFRLC